ncbi:MAG TPA: hypothetical protein VGV61_12070 [Thermoanaerobaculia bacterium]|nr:hypothetical protein [Thermoanaerobaculia bacterium]
MIAFATLWLGLVAGVVPVELLVGPEVTRVELRLDGNVVAALAGPPWRASCDLGGELAPHELLATAFDAAGKPLGEARQWLNLPRPAAELEVAITPRPAGGALARLAWAAPAGAAPLVLQATLDGAPLPVAADHASVELPPVAHGAAKLLRIEADFPGGVSATRELALGGDLASEVSTDLTGVPVELGERGARGALVLRDGDDELPVVAFEEGSADLVVVIDPAARAALADLQRQGNRHRIAPIGGDPRSGAGVIRIDRSGIPLPADTALRLVWPVAERHPQTETHFDLFPTSPEQTAPGSLLARLQAAGGIADPETAPRLADAVALAALTAAEQGHRRAVLLLLGPAPADASLYPAPVVRRYLARLRVPLLVWATAPPPAGVVADWGAAESVTTLARWEAAARRLDQLLDRQRIAWVEGRHLPQRLLTPASGALRLAVAPPEVAVEATAGTATRPAPAMPPPAPPAVVTGDEDAPATSASTTAVDAAAERPAPTIPGHLVVGTLPPFALATDATDPWLLRALGRAAAALPADFAARFGLRPTPAGTVVLFAAEEEFRDWLVDQGGGDSGVEGFARGGVAALAVGTYHHDDVTALMVHELAHLLTRAACGPLPSWLEEGLAEELAMSRRDGEGHTVVGSLRATSSTQRVGLGGPGAGATYQITLAGPAAALVSLVRGPRPPLVDLLAMPRESFVAPAGRPQRYAAAALFVRYLLDGEQGTRRQRFRAFLGGVAAGGAADQPALEAALGVPVTKLQAPFDAWLRRTAEVAARR